MEGKFKNFTASEMAEYIKHTKADTDDEWLEIQDWINEFLSGNPSEEEKKLFVPLGWAECVGIICDGIIRWRNSICIKCKKQQGYTKYTCEIYQENKQYIGGIPNEIWANENAECPYCEK